MLAINYLSCSDFCAHHRMYSKTVVLYFPKTDAKKRKKRKLNIVVMLLVKLNIYSSCFFTFTSRHLLTGQNSY